MNNHANAQGSSPTASDLSNRLTPLLLFQHALRTNFERQTR